MAKLFGYALVCVQTENPFMSGLVRRKLLLQRKARPLSRNNACPASFCNLTRSISRLRINNQNLIGPGDGLARGPYILLFVECDNRRGDFHEGQSKVN